MRNCLFMATLRVFLKTEAATELFRRATGGSLDTSTMRDREFVNRFCAFQLLPLDDYRGDMDDFLARALKYMNTCDKHALEKLSAEFRRASSTITSCSANMLLGSTPLARKTVVCSMRRSGM